MSKQVVVITGGNKGLGYEIARQCCALGFLVVITARDAVRGRTAAEELGCEFTHLDLDDASSIRACAEELNSKYDRIDVLINNAGVMVPPSDPMSWKQKTRIMVETNFFRTMDVCEALFPLVKEGGQVIFMASRTGHLRIIPSEARRSEFAAADSTLTKEGLCQLMTQFIADVEETASEDPAPPSDGPHVAKGWPSFSYGMSKLADVALTKVYARELAPRGIAVNCCCPGPVATDLNPGGKGTVQTGADTPVWMASQPASAVTGQFFQERTACVW